MSIQGLMLWLPSRRARWQAWLMACRPATLTAALAPVAVGTACAYVTDGLALFPALAALAGALLIQIGTNLANDVFDFEKGADTNERLGPVRVVQSGLLSATAVRRGMWLVFGLAGLVGLYLCLQAGPLIVIVGLVSIVCGIAYTAGPFPLGYLGLGDLFVMIFFGFVAVGGTAYVQAGHLPSLAWWAAIPVGALSTAILVVNNVRDRHTDAKVGKKTLAVRLGKVGSLAEYGALIGASYLVPALLAWFYASGWLLLCLLTLPLAIRLTLDLWRHEGHRLNPVLGGTARLLLLHGGLFALGIVLGCKG